MKQHLLGASAAGDHADSGFDQADISLRMGLATSGVQANLRSAAERHSKRRYHHRTRAELDRGRHLLEGVNRCFHFLPLAVLREQQ